jgi:hypothetical protein
MVALAGSCTVGDGNGAASGPIWFLGCGTDGSDFGSQLMPRLFDLSPRFFAGEPIEDISVSMKANRLLIRVQRNGNRIEINDTLYLDVQNAYEIARCVRGRINDTGLPDYDDRMTTDLFTGLPTNTPWCDWSGGAAPGGGDAGGGDAGAGTDAGGAGPVLPAVGRHARIHLGTDELVRSSLSLLLTCHKANTVGLAFDGWIDFQSFGDALQTDTPPEQRPAIGSDFKVNFGDRLRATFQISRLDDQRIFNAIKTKLPPPDPLIGGTLDGFFDFDLERGRAAQPFP